MASRMLTIAEAGAMGLSPDPFVFADVTHRVPSDYRALDPDATTTYHESRWFFVQCHEIVDANGLDMVWLSIRRNDRKPLSDFRHLQRIKNALAGEEWEGVQLYPAESRLMDESNQTHLWCYPPGLAFPFGYAKRSVLTAAEGRALDEALRLAGRAGHSMPVQRPFSDEEEAASRPLEELTTPEAMKGASATIHRPRNPRSNA